jgi:hypothetical protein
MSSESTERPGKRDEAIRCVSQQLCRLNRTNTCVMDERPYRGHCRADNCRVVDAVQQLLTLLEST